MSTSRLVRTRPASLPRVSGLAVPGFICNGNYYFTEMKVFADGLFDCWGGVDLAFLAKHFDSGWISAGVPHGAVISIHETIQAQVVSAEWSHDASSLHERLMECLRQLNPSMENLFDFKGEDVEVRDGVRFAKVGLMEAMPCQHNAGERGPLCQSRFAFVRHDGQLYLTPLRIYADGRIDVSPRYNDERLIEWNDFQREVSEGSIRVTVPNDTCIEIDAIGRFTVRDVWSSVKRSAQLLKEVRETIETLNGKPGSVTKCREAFQAYLDNPTVATRARLKEAYEAVTEHHRMYVGDMDTKDIPVRMIIYGEQEIENWSHRAVARSRNQADLPTIDVPKPRDAEGGEEGDEPTF